MTRAAGRRDARGFTLLELLVVVFIIGIIATMFTLAVGVAGGADKELRQETERLQTLIGLALEDASFQAHEMGLRFYPDHYEFAIYDRGNLLDPSDDTWKPITEDVFAPRTLPPVFAFELEIGGRSVNLERSAKDVEKIYKPQLFIYSSGDISDAFKVTIRSVEEDHSYSLAVETDGSTKVTKDGD